MHTPLQCRMCLVHGLHVFSAVLRMPTTWVTRVRPCSVFHRYVTGVVCGWWWWMLYCKRRSVFGLPRGNHNAVWFVWSSENARCTQHWSSAPGVACLQRGYFQQGIGNMYSALCCECNDGISEMRAQSGVRNTIGGSTFSMICHFV